MADLIPMAHIKGVETNQILIALWMSCAYKILFSKVLLFSFDS
jgi:hypothetical protein